MNHLNKVIESKNNIYICQTEKKFSKGGSILYMYKPIYLSVLSICKYLKKQDDISNIHTRIILNNKYDKWDEFKKNDIFIWIGNANLSIVPFKSLTKRGVYTIFYHTETKGCPDLEVKEIWNYSRYNMILSKPKLNLRFIPIIYDQNKVKINYSLINHSDIRFTFFGGLKGCGKDEKWKYLNSIDFIKDRLYPVYNIWSDKSFDQFLSRPGICIFINLHNTLYKNKIALETVRINKLLGIKAIILSEHSDSVDEKDYHDLVYFHNIEEMETRLRYLLNLSTDELKEIAENIYIKFKNRFSVTNVVNKLIE